MGLYTPEFKELISDEAKVLVEDSGKIVKTNFPKAVAANGLDFAILENDEGYFLTVGTYETIVDKISQELPVFGLIYKYFSPMEGVNGYHPQSLFLSVEDVGGEFINVYSQDNTGQYEGFFSIDINNNVNYTIPEPLPPT